MIKLSSSGTVVITIDETDYYIDDDESYKKLLIVLTDPDPDVCFPDDMFDIDQTIQDSDQIKLVTRYSDFFKAYSKRRDAKINEKLAPIRNGIIACDNAIESLNYEHGAIDE